MEMGLKRRKLNMAEVPNFVQFDEYCSLCKHINKNGNEHPCNECLDEPVNFKEYGSRKPVYFEERN